LEPTTLAARSYREQALEKIGQAIYSVWDALEEGKPSIPNGERYQEMLREVVESRLGGKVLEHVVHWILLDSGMEYEAGMFADGSDMSFVYRNGKEISPEAVERGIERYKRLVFAKLDKARI
jgi:hypothetical protein